MKTIVPKIEIKILTKERIKNRLFDILSLNKVKINSIKIAGIKVYKGIKNTAKPQLPSEFRGDRNMQIVKIITQTI